tara:strand:+ start:235 stop:681 length:447 start_codon:yes stop_codon:yes gene_type:complete
MKNLSIRKTNRFTISQIKKGMKIKLKKTMTRKYFVKSIKLLNDSAPIHTSNKWARRLGMENKIFPGLAVVSVFSKLIGMYLPGKNAVLMNINFSFRKPVFQNDILTYECEVHKVIRTFKLVILKLSVFKKNYKIIDGDCKCKVLVMNE